MRKRTVRQFILLAVMVGVALILAGCPDDKDESVSIDERITSFMDDVNAGRYSRLQRHIHPDAEQYAQSAAASTWSPSPFSPGVTYELGTRNRNDSVVTAPITGGVFSGETATFVMLEDGSKIWKIRRLTIGSAFDLRSIE